MRPPGRLQTGRCQGRECQFTDGGNTIFRNQTVAVAKNMDQPQSDLPVRAPDLVQRQMAVNLFP